MKHVKSIYFIGAGGIGMSALIRYFLSQGLFVAGYDQTATPLTVELIKEGANLHFTDEIAMIPDRCKKREQCLVVYTPAVPQTHHELRYFIDNGFDVMKRAEMLGRITKNTRGLCIAGTHGKTTISSMIAHLLNQSEVGCNAFLGGILKNEQTNLILSEKSDLTVIEADEYDRSFHHLSPYMAVITSADPDHLDIYGTPQAYRESFEHFTSLIVPQGVLIMKEGVAITPQCATGVTCYSYAESSSTADFYASAIRIGHGTIIFDFVGPDITITDIELGVPMKINIENAVAAIALAWLNGVHATEIREAMRGYAGTLRRFEFHIKEEQLVLIDDYAHHPEELKKSILSVKALYPDRKITAIFQPHLFTRTRDFAEGFAESLSLLDELFLLDIYPAREEPIPGVTSEIIFEKVTIQEKKRCTKEQLLDLLEGGTYEVLMTLGAGDLDQLIPSIKKRIHKQ